jgi:para-aminobenzoate synthetase/4-amino-4-deoxychorismate lyase
VATHAGQVRDVLSAAHRAALQGAWCVGHVRYEAAPAFDAALQTHPADGPLAVFQAFDRAEPWPAEWDGLADAAPRAAWADGSPRPVFDAALERVQRAIADGEVYQVNHTAPWRAQLPHAHLTDKLALFAALHRAQPGGYAAWLDMAGEQVLSVSPELFFDWDGQHLLTRPMKGTAPRGATPEADAAAATALLASPKERAENVMIVDLLRNDVSRVALPHSVHVPTLFALQALPTVWQMTSDVTALTRPGTTLADVFAALFPCGSVTGAPKVRAMQLIRQTEPAPRGVYCGAIGVLQPGGAARFNVPIRTVVCRGAELTCGIGSGITAGSLPDGEWAEWQHKRRFLQAGFQ